MKVDLSAQECTKMWPSLPPVRGEVVLIDGKRCRVTRCRLRFDGLQWTIKSLRVRPVR